jgi:hypothetical protein
MSVHLMGVYFMGVYLMSVHLIGMHLISVYFMGVHLIGMHLMSVHLTGVYLMGVHFMGVHRRMQPFLLSRTYIFAAFGGPAFLILALSGNLTLPAVPSAPAVLRIHNQALHLTHRRAPLTHVYI